MLNIKALREQRNLSQVALSQITGLAQPYISDLETGQKTNPSLESLLALSAALECSVNELLKGEETA